MTSNRETPIEINKEEFKKIGYHLIDTVSDFIDSIDKMPLTKGESPQVLQQLLGNSSLPEKGIQPEVLLSRTIELMLNHSLFNSHPKFMGYITSSPAPIGMFADFLAAAVNQNVGAQMLSPMATEIEKQTVKWLTEFIGLSDNFGGILVSGGNMANFTAFLAARTAKAPKSIKEEGLSNSSKKLITYCSKTTHTWVEKATILFGHGSKSIRWIATDEMHKMDNDLLEQEIKNDKSINLYVSKSDIDVIRQQSGNKIPEERLEVIAKGHKLSKYAKDVLNSQQQLPKIDFQKMNAYC